LKRNIASFYFKYSQKEIVCVRKKRRKFPENLPKAMNSTTRFRRINSELEDAGEEERGERIWRPCSKSLILLLLVFT